MAMQTADQGLEIDLAVPTSDDYWGRYADAYERDRAVHYHEAATFAWLRARYPAARISSRRVDETISAGNQTTVWRDDAPDEDTARDIADLGPDVAGWTWGDTLAYVRGQRGLTQAEVARLVGRHVNTVARWERGELTPEPLVQDAVLIRLGE